MEPGTSHQPGSHRRLLTEIIGASGDASSLFYQGVNVTDKSEQEYQDLLDELNSVLSDRTEAAVADRIALRDAVCHYVEAEQSRGTPLPTIIATVREILREAEPEPANVPGHLAEQLVEWCRQFHGKRAAGDLQ
jgi:ElaB/YqjD/DUF883 family membrane-anchored ribosome-binding protein